jgi:hypothetical protein
MSLGLNHSGPEVTISLLPGSSPTFRRSGSLSFLPPSNQLSTCQIFLEHTKGLKISWSRDTETCSEFPAKPGDSTTSSGGTRHSTEGWQIPGWERRALEIIEKLWPESVPSLYPPMEMASEGCYFSVLSIKTQGHVLTTQVLCH